MRKLAALALLFSAQAFACPQLAGVYTCSYQDNSSEIITITQELKDGVTVYTHNGSQIPADNQSYPVPDDANLRSATYRAFCPDAATLSANLVGKFYQDGQFYGDLDMTSNFTLEGANLKNVVTGTLKNQGGDYPLNSEVLCTRN